MVSLKNVSEGMANFSPIQFNVSSQVLLSLLTSFVVELIKERKTIHKLVYPHRHSSVEYEGHLLRYDWILLIFL